MKMVDIATTTRMVVDNVQKLWWSLNANLAGSDLTLEGYKIFLLWSMSACIREVCLCTKLSWTHLGFSTGTLSCAKSNRATPIWVSIISCESAKSCEPRFQAGCGDVPRPWPTHDDLPLPLKQAWLCVYSPHFFCNFLRSLCGLKCSVSPVYLFMPSDIFLFYCFIVFTLSCFGGPVTLLPVKTFLDCAAT